jgi:FkbM family methyltransferase
MNFLKIEDPISICDIGAAPCEKQILIDSLLDNTNCKLTGFEPNKIQFDKLNESKNKKYYNFAIGDGKEKILNICKAPGMSSFLKPDNNYNKMFHNFFYWGQIIDKIKVKTKKLDDIETDFDLIKIDVQGYESELIKYGKNKIKNSLVIQIEVSPISSYIDAKPFPYVYNQLENLDFDLHMFSNIENRSFAPLIINNSTTTGLYYLYQLDCVFVKKFKIIDSLELKDLLKLIHIMHYGFQAYDFVLNLILSLNKKFKINVIEEYKKILKSVKIIPRY